jgi:DNA modification methylase
MMSAGTPDEAPVVSARVRNTLNDLSARDWVRRTKSVMFQRGLGPDHPESEFERRHPCPFSYQDAGELITFFTRHGDKVLDPFVGVGSTLKACALSGRLGTGIELNPLYCAWAHERIKTEIPSAQHERYSQRIIQGDARVVVRELLDDEFDFVLSSPPYWRILGKALDKKSSASSALREGTLAYSSDPRDFGCIADYDAFVAELAAFVNSWRRVVKPRRYIALIVADFRDGQTLYPYHADLIAAIRCQSSAEGGGRRLVLQGIKILAQNQKRLYAYGYPTTYVPNIHHHYVLIYRSIPVS